MAPIALFIKEKHKEVRKEVDVGGGRRLGTPCRLLLAEDAHGCAKIEQECSLVRGLLNIEEEEKKRWVGFCSTC